MASTLPSLFAALQKHPFINLTTFRKTGAAVVTPVWFALVDGKLLGTTQSQTGKLKRIRNNPQVRVAPAKYNGQPLGDSIAGVARILTPQETRAADSALRRKYGLQYLFLLLSLKLRGGQQSFWEVTPAQ